MKNETVIKKKRPVLILGTNYSKDMENIINTRIMDGYKRSGDLIINPKPEGSYTYVQVMELKEAKNDN